VPRRPNPLPLRGGDQGKPPGIACIPWFTGAGWLPGPSGHKPGTGKRAAARTAALIAVAFAVINRRDA
jgi:hypothetical protein